MSDRGMKKWAPYKSLVEQEKYLKKAHDDNEKIERPILSSDEMEEINEKLVNYSNEEVIITYWRDNKINSVTTLIKKIDADNKKIILPDRKSIYFHELINIEYSFSPLQ